MLSLAAGLLALLCITQISYSLEFLNADLNHVLKYLQKQNNVATLSHSNEDLHTHNEGKHRDLHKHSFKYRHDDGRNAISYDTSEIKHPGLNKIANLLQNKHETTYEVDSKNNPQDYSKVYLVLDPQAKINAVDVKRIGEIVSSLLASKGKLETKHFPKKLARRYKGFPVMDDFFARRRSRDSKEKFSKDSIERDYKPKRARNDYAGAGRTAIPYIGHRGDIYEKE